MSTASGERYTWTNGWTYVADNSSDEASSEVISLESDYASVLFSYGPLGMNMDSARDQLIASLLDVADDSVEVDRGAYNNVSYSLDKLLVSGVELATFTLFIERSSDIQITMVIGSAAFFAQGVDTAQAGISIDGSPILPGIQGSGLQAALDGSPTLSADDSGDDADDVETPVPTEEPAPTEEPVETEEADETPVDDGGDEQDVSDFEDIGVVEDGFYQSPQFDLEVEWSSDWTVSSGESDTASGTDILALSSVGLNGFSSIQFFEPSSTASIESVYAYVSESALTAEDGYEQLFADVNDDEANAVFLSEDDELGELVDVVVGRVYDGGDVVMVAQFVMTVDDAEDVLAAIQDGVTVEGDPLAALIDADDFADAIGGGTSTRGNGDDDDNTVATGDFADAGVIEAGLFESPQFGTEITWSDDWEVVDAVSEVDELTDSIVLGTSDDTYAIVSVLGVDGEGIDADALEELLGSFADATNGDLLLSDSRRDEANAVWIADDETLGEAVTFGVAITLRGGDVLVLIRVVTPVDVADTTLDLLQSTIEVAGEPVGGLVDADDLANEL